uniref:G-protein coupled receptors family 1 profile domain-containing protein n=1 Tax=Panagrolaimus sp. ES5 TaxID=591445 RepID=A0AC34GRF3_9BILA
MSKSVEDDSEQASPTISSLIFVPFSNKSIVEKMVTTAAAAAREEENIPFELVEDDSEQASPTISSLIFVPFSNKSIVEKMVTTAAAAAREEENIPFELDNEILSSLSLLFTFIMIFMCLAGAFMNTLSLIIFTSKSFRRRSINVLLAGLSASDLCLLILAIPVFSLSQIQKVIPGNLI